MEHHISVIVKLDVSGILKKNVCESELGIPVTGIGVLLSVFGIHITLCCGIILKL